MLVGYLVSGVVFHKSASYSLSGCLVHLPRTRLGGHAAVVVSEEGGAAMNGTSSVVCVGMNVNLGSSVNAPLSDSFGDDLSVGTES